LPVIIPPSRAAEAADVLDYVTERYQYIHIENHLAVRHRLRKYRLRLSAAAQHRMQVIAYGRAQHSRLRIRPVSQLGICWASGGHNRNYRGRTEVFLVIAARRGGSLYIYQYADIWPQRTIRDGIDSLIKDLTGFRYHCQAFGEGRLPFWVHTFHFVLSRFASPPHGSLPGPDTERVADTPVTTRPAAGAALTRSRRIVLPD